MTFQWTEAQEEAINAKNKNILVSAAAGSGKTAVLVERVIRRITDTEAPLDIDEFLIMTFTKAAAAQMKEKIRKAVVKALKERPEDEHLRRQFLKLSSANIMTIDSLCMKIVKENPEAVKTDPAVRIADEAELKLLKTDVLAEVIENLYASGDEKFKALAEYCTERDDRELEEMISEVYDFSQSYPWPERWAAEAISAYTRADRMEEQEWFAGIKAFVKNKFDEIIQMMSLAVEISEGNHGPAKYADTLKAEKENFERMSMLGFDEAYLEIKLFEGFAKLPTIRKTDIDVSEEKKQAVQDIRKSYKKEITDLQKGIFAKSPEEYKKDLEYNAAVAEALIYAVKEFSKAYSMAKAKRQTADFSDIAHAAVDALVTVDEDGNRIYSDAALRMRKNYREIIVDEYQDTNRLQEELIRALASDSVFMVGDVKQSIYAFRMACPDLFVEKYEAYAGTADDDNGAVTSGNGGEETADKENLTDNEASADKGDLQEKEEPANTDDRRIVLGENFRSRKEVLDFSNFIFSQIMIKDVGNITYDENNRLNFKAEGYETHPLPNGAATEVIFIDDSGAHAKQAEADVIAGTIKDILKEGKVWDHEKNDHRNAEYSDIVILTRTGENRELEKTLELEGIPVIKQSGKGYFDRLEVRLALNLLKIIDNPFQDIPFAAVLKSPAAQITSTELALIKASYSEAGFNFYDAARKYKGNKELEAKLEAFLDMLADFRKKAIYLGVYELLEYVLEKSGLYDLAEAMPQGKSRTANLKLLKDKAYNFSKGTYSALFGFNRYIDQLESLNIDYGSAQIADEKAGAVRIMTIHKSKGLEFPYVILAQSGKNFNMNEYKSDLICDKDYGIGLRKKDAETRITEKTLAWRAIEQKKKSDQIAEEIRILYVALTRAKEKLVIVGTGKRLADKKRNFRTELGTKAIDLKPYMILKEKNYLSLIMKALIRSRHSLETPDEEMPEGFTDNPFYDHPCEFGLTLLTGEDAETARILERFEKERILEGLDEIKRADADISGLEENIEYVYPMHEATTAPGKISPSSLEAVSDEERHEKPDRGKIKKPAGGLSFAERGTAYHKVFEQLDHERDVSEQIKELRENNKLSESETKAIDCEKIKSFLASDIGKRMREAQRNGSLKREAEFMMGIEKNGDMVLVQGIIDAYFITDKGIVIVDYKTDGNKTEEEFRKTYAGQINCYAEALEKALSLPVVEKIIYSTELKKEILL